MKKIIVIILIVIISGNAIAQTTTVPYTANAAGIITNPERGFCEYSIVTDPTSAFGLTASSFTSLAAKNHSIIFRLYYLKPYLSTATIPAAFITKLNADFNAIRAAGFKVILRFAYNDVTPATPPYLDAPNKTLLLSHINQLKPTILAASDVIMLFESGFWGTYGENYYTDFYGNISTETITPTHIADRKAIVDAMFTCVGPSRKLAVRTPPIKAAYYNQVIPTDTITLAQANNGTPITRVGGFNDCFLAEFNDYTYADTTTEKPFWATESNYTIMGGETCINNALYANCVNAQKELSRFHWTFCNDLYQGTIVGPTGRWNTEGCLTTIKNNLGYRIKLLSGTFSSATAMPQVTYNITLRNDGYAAPVNPRNVILVFKNTVSPFNSFTRAINTDPRLWFSGKTITLAGTINTPTTLTAGNYTMALLLSDPAPTLTNVKYNIQLANTGTWDATNGVNNLNHTVNLVAGNGIVPVKILSFSGEMIGGNVKLDWKINSDIAIKNMEVEYSTDGISFSTINTQNFDANIAEYTAYHTTIQKNKMLYRLKIVFPNGNYEYSNIIALKGLTNNNGFQLNGNTFHNQINFFTYDKVAGNVMVFSTDGKLMYTNNIAANTGSIDCSTWSKGIYFIKYPKNSGVETAKVIVF
jgi:hypothetical protein